MNTLELIAKIGLPVAFLLLPLAILTISRAIRKRRIKRATRQFLATRLFF